MEHMLSYRSSLEANSKGSWYRGGALAGGSCFYGKTHQVARYFTAVCCGGHNSLLSLTTPTFSLIDLEDLNQHFAPTRVLMDVSYTQALLRELCVIPETPI